jgi:hypothetical protein
VPVDSNFYVDSDGDDGSGGNDDGDRDDGVSG